MRWSARAVVSLGCVGAGAVLAVGGAGVAAAEPRQSPSAESAAESSAGAPAGPEQGPVSPRRETGRRITTADRPGPASAQSDPSDPSAPKARSRPPVRVGPAARTANARATNGGLGALFDNRSPTLNPAISGQAADGTVTGNLNIADADSGVLRSTLVTGAKHGSVTIDEDGRFSYTPDPSLAATGVTDSFAVAVSDEADGFHLHGLAGLINLLTFGLLGASGHTTRTTVTVSVAPFGSSANTAPTATFSAGTPDPGSGVVTGLVSGSDADGDPLSYTGSTTTAKGSVIVSAGGGFIYTPTPAARHGAAALAGTAADRSDVFTVTVADGRGGTAAVAVAVVVGPRNAAPTASATVGSPDPESGVVTGTVTAADADGDPLTFTGSATTAKGAVIVTAAGTFSYTPTAAARLAAASPTATAADRRDGFTVTVDDAHGGTTSLAVSVSLGPSDAPTPPPTGSMAVGMNLESVVDWSPAWTFTDAFKASRPWISHAFNPQTFGLSWDPADAPTLDIDADGNVRSLKTWTDNGVAMRQYAGTLMFRGLGGGYAGGTYHAEWDGTGVVSFGMDATVISSGTTAAGRNFADLRVTPTDDGIYLRIEETNPANPVRNINVWMPDYNGQSFTGQRWQPGAAFSPFHPLFLARLAPFDTLRFMAMQETNSSDIVTWSQRRDAGDIRQGSGPEGTPSEPLVNGMSVEYMVELANRLDADPWFNMPHQADDTFVRNFATYVLTNLEPGRTVYVEWSNELWNFGWGFEASAWVADRARAAGLDPDYGQWIVTGQEAKRDLDIWSSVFASQSSLDLVRVAGGWAAVPWVTNEVLENMGGSFDAIAIAPYITPTDEQRASYSGSTTVDRVLTDTRTNIAASVQWVADHEQLAAEWSTRLGRPIDVVAYEGGAHLDGRNAAYQNAFYAATNDARMGEIYRDYLLGLDAAGLDLYLDFQFTGQPGATPWGDFAKLHRMDEPLATAWRYNAVLSAANGSLWTGSL